MQPCYPLAGLDWQPASEGAVRVQPVPGRHWYGRIGAMPELILYSSSSTTYTLPYLAPAIGMSAHFTTRLFDVSNRTRDDTIDALARKETAHVGG